MSRPEGRHHLVVGEVLVVIFVDGMSAGLCVGPSGVLVAVEAKLQVFGKRHGPRVVGQRHHWSHLETEEESVEQRTFVLSTLDQNLSDTNLSRICSGL